MIKDSGITKKLFEAVIDYCEELDSGSRTIEDELDKVHPLVVFVENFLEQFSTAHCRQRIVGLTDRSAKQLLNERRRLKRRHGRPAAQRLIYRLEQFCGQVEEVRYSSSEADAEDFHLQYFPSLLERIVDWMDELANDAETRQKADEARNAYNNSVGLE